MSPGFPVIRIGSWVPSGAWAYFSDKGPPLLGRPFTLPIPSYRPPARRSRRRRLANSPDGSGAEEQRLDDLGARPTKRSTSREPLLAQRVLAREPKHQPRRRSIDRRNHRFEPGHFLRNPAPPARLDIPGHERSAIGLIHEFTGGDYSTVKQGLVRKHERSSTEVDPYSVGPGSDTNYR